MPFASASELRDLVNESQQIVNTRRQPERSDNPYALLPDTLELLSVLLEQLSPALVVEFGSGESTRLFAAWAAAKGRRLVSVEHDRGWVEEVGRRLMPEQRGAVKMLHMPLRLVRGGLRQFLTYRSLEQLASEVRQAGFILLDGPHISGREKVLYFVLSHCSPGATIVVDDFRHYSVREMLLGVPEPMAKCFAGEPIMENSHGLYVLRCLRAPPSTPMPNLGLRSILRSYWRCLRDFRAHGTGN